MFFKEKDSIKIAKKQIIAHLGNRGLMSVCFPGGSEEWIYQKGKFFSSYHTGGIRFEELRKRIKKTGDYRMYVFGEETALKITPEKIIQFDRLLSTFTQRRNVHCEWE